MAVILLIDKLELKPILMGTGTVSATLSKNSNLSSSLSGTATISTKNTIPIRGFGKNNLNGNATVSAKQPLRLIRPDVRIVAGLATINAKQPTNIRHTKLNPIKGTASANVDIKVRIRHVDNPALNRGSGAVSITSDLWKYKTVRGHLKTESKLEAYIFEWRDIARDVNDYLPKYYEDSIEVKAISQTVGNEFLRYNALAFDVLNQMYPETATWGLARWEKDFKIETNLSRPIEERRAEILERIHGYYEVTKELLQAEADKFFPTRISHFPKELYIKIEIMTKMDINSIEYKRFVKKMLDLIPCHLEVDIRAKSTTWGEVKDLGITWGEMKDQKMSWSAIKQHIFIET